MSVVFSTPGLIPLEAFTIFGAHSKPNTSNPIGFFGTGLKYAIAVCLRHGQEVILYRGGKKYTFYVRQDKFRDREFGFIYMKVQSWLGNLWGRGGTRKLPFTTELGKTWELWQAFRELEANTRDELGTTYLWEQEYTKGMEFPDDGRLQHDSSNPNWTALVVHGQRFADEWHDRGRTFLEDGLSLREGESIQVIERPCKHVYYRGMRVMDLKEEAAYTYNFLCHVELTEDRTAKQPWMLEMQLTQMIAKSEEPEFVRNTVPRRSYSGPSRWEHTLSSNFAYADSPSPVFLEVAKEAKSDVVRDLWDKQQPTIRTRTVLHVQIPKPDVTDDEIRLLAAKLQEVMPGAIIQDENFRTFGAEPDPEEPSEAPSEEDESDDVPF